MCTSSGQHDCEYRRAERECSDSDHQWSPSPALDVYEDAIDKYDSRRKPSGTISRRDTFFQPCPGASLGEATKAIEKAEKDIQLPTSIHAAFQGTAAAFQNSLASDRF